jgi:hypothetical protein
MATVAAALSSDSGGRKSDDVPVAVIRWGCTPREEVYRGTLGTIAAVTAGRELSPCIMVVGAVAAMGAGKKAGVTGLQAGVDAGAGVAVRAGAGTDVGAAVEQTKIEAEIEAKGGPAAQ